MAKRQDWAGEVFRYDTPTDGVSFNIAVANRVWDPLLLMWVNMTQPGGGGGGGSVTQGSVPWSVDDYQLAMQFDASASPILYLGQAVPGSLTSAAVWRIQRFDVTSGVIVKWAAGVSTFSQVWDNRAALAYS
jgi:hypothetical protein